MDGAQFTGYYLGASSPSSSIVDSRGDYNGDGKSDLLWRDTDGTVAMWLMDGSQYSAATLGVADSSWSLVSGHDDYNGDGKSDLLWRNSDGTVATWLMDGAQFTGQYLGVMGSSWSITDAVELGASVNGDNANNTLNGTVGRDTIYGGAGNDTVAGGAGADQFMFNTALDGVSNVDTLVDFTSGEDKLILSEIIFSNAPTGVLGAANFVAEAGAVAHDANDFILYDTTTGAVSYDPDGSGAQAAIVFAMLTNHPVLAAEDVYVSIV
jgi:Ca2+-binding RTX toxin-like protein